MSIASDLLPLTLLFQAFTSLTMRPMHAQPAQISLEKSLLLKGLAIIPVVAIHYFAYLPNIYTTSHWQLLYITLDQLGRFCVPLFLLLSGYGLALKYKDEQPAWWPFFKKRALKLIPLYVLWSVVSYILLSIVPAWKYPGQPVALWFQLLTGSADYQLYFVVLIFQLYALFPLALRLVKKFPNATLLAAFAFQLLLFCYYSSRELPGQYNLDGLQYLISFSWIGYFVFGIWLVLKPVPVKLHKLFLLLTLITATVMIWHSWYLIKHGTDPLLALKFTRFPVAAYAVASCLMMITLRVQQQTSTLLNRVQNVLKYLGQDSYIIFLAHTIGLRILFSVQRDLISWPIAIMVTCTWLTTILLSKKLSAA